MIDPDKFIIRDTSIWDAEWLFKITGDANATRYMGFRTHETLDDTHQMLAAYGVSSSKHMAVCLRDAPSELLGIIGYEVFGHVATVLIMLNMHDMRGRGIGRLVCKPFVHSLLAQPSIWRVWSFCHVDNVIGHRVTERSGAKFEGVMKRYAVFPNVSDEPQDCRLYAITKEDSP